VLPSRLVINGDPGALGFMTQAQDSGRGPRQRGYVLDL